MHKADVLKTHFDNAKLKEFGLRIQYTRFMTFKTLNGIKKIIFISTKSMYQLFSM